MVGVNVDKLKKLYVLYITKGAQSKQTFFLDTYDLNPPCHLQSSEQLKLSGAALLTDIVASRYWDSAARKQQHILFINDSGYQCVWRFDITAQKCVEPKVLTGRQIPLSLCSNLQRLLVTTRSALLVYNVTNSEPICQVHIQITDQRAVHAVEIDELSFIVALAATSFDKHKNQVCQFNSDGKMVRSFVNDNQPPRYLSLYRDNNLLVAYSTKADIVILDENLNRKTEINASEVDTDATPMRICYLKDVTPNALYIGVESGDVKIFHVQ